MTCLLGSECAKLHLFLNIVSLFCPLLSLAPLPGVPLGINHEGLRVLQVLMQTQAPVSHERGPVGPACGLAQLCPTLRDPMDCSPLGSSVRGILQARILEWVAMPSSRGSSRPKG